MVDSGRFETVPAGDLVPGDAVIEPVSGAVVTVTSVEPGPRGGPRLHLGKVWALWLDCDSSEQPFRRLRA